MNNRVYIYEYYIQYEYVQSFKRAFGIFILFSF